VVKSINLSLVESEPLLFSSQLVWYGWGSGCWISLGLDVRLVRDSGISSVGQVVKSIDLGLVESKPLLLSSQLVWGTWGSGCWISLSLDVRLIRDSSVSFVRLVVKSINFILEKSKPLLLPSWSSKGGLVGIGLDESASVVWSSYSVTVGLGTPVEMTGVVVSVSLPLLLTSHSWHVSDPSRLSGRHIGDSGVSGVGLMVEGLDVVTSPLLPFLLSSNWVGWGGGSSWLGSHLVESSSVVWSSALDVSGPVDVIVSLRVIIDSPLLFSSDSGAVSVPLSKSSSVVWSSALDVSGPVDVIVSLRVIIDSPLLLSSDSRAVSVPLRKSSSCVWRSNLMLVGLGTPVEMRRVSVVVFLPLLFTSNCGGV